jgi:DNA-binding transcriptional MerR regulator
MQDWQEPKPEGLTIGELAHRSGLNTSALRYYEEQGLLTPISRTPAGYRIYAPEAGHTLQLIRRAQRLGFSLSDIRILIQSLQSDQTDNGRMRELTLERYYALERQITQLLVQEHELGLFLRDLDRNTNQLNPTPFPLMLNRMLQRVCSDPLEAPVDILFDMLIEKSGCILNSDEGKALLQSFRGKHVHIWLDGDCYHILVVSDDPTVGQALLALSNLISNCQVHSHSHQAGEMFHNGEGFVLITCGENAFILARLFLMLEDKEEHSF